MHGTENFLADHLEKSGYSVSRRQIIGRYEVDLVIENLIIVEVDGYHHVARDRAKADQRKGYVLRGQGYEVLRIEAHRVADIEERRALTEEVQALLDAHSEIRAIHNPTALNDAQRAALENIRNQMDDGKDEEASESDARSPQPSEDPEDMMWRYLDQQFPREPERE